MVELLALILWIAGLAVLAVAVFPVVARVNLIALGLFLIFLALLILTYFADIFGMGTPAAIP